MRPPGGPIFGTVFRFIFWSILYQGCRSAKFRFHWTFVAYGDRKSNCKTGLQRRHRIQPAEGPVLDPRAKETCFKKGQKVDPLEIKSGSPWRVQFLLRRYFKLKVIWLATAAAGILNWGGPFLCACFLSGPSQEGGLKRRRGGLTGG